MSKFRIGLLTGGGDCPGLNSVIRAVVKTAINNYGYEVIGFKDGYLGLVYNRFMKLGLSDVSGLLDRGGTILGTTNNFDPFRVLVDHDGEKQYRDLSDRVADTLRMHDIQCLIVIGGTNTINIAHRLIKEKGIRIVAIPKTIDNDVPETDVTIGFMTSVNTATQALDKLHSTAESHHRVMILEVMGAASGWVSLEAGIAGGADIILIPGRWPGASWSARTRGKASASSWCRKAADPLVITFPRIPLQMMTYSLSTAQAAVWRPNLKN